MTEKISVLISEAEIDKRIRENFVCSRISNQFVVGYGLDYDQKYRNLPYVGVVEFI